MVVESSKEIEFIGKMEKEIVIRSNEKDGCKELEDLEKEST